MTREWCISVYLGPKDMYWLIFIGFAITVLSRNFLSKVTGNLALFMHDEILEGRE